ncbi:M3 family metallopeptidase [Brevibacterium sp. p3-SID960]|uniref:M3 family metallopeptidase n=1 Tax=Brevibacterium sp. p3-SID960 TaxID=2916063 RepID=UPI0021A352A5|nr:M3 family metallopeptidase [Brevibacterium sp. p3-SID960]MCT1689475.1 M3 family metallopeptidase [Brevibacterium sp. p3-SID960]
MHSDGHPAASEPTSSPADGTALASTPVTAPGANPVLDYVHGPVGLRLPDVAAIEPGHFTTAAEAVVAEQRQAVAAILAQADEPSLTNTTIRIDQAKEPAFRLQALMRLFESNLQTEEFGTALAAASQLLVRSRLQLLLDGQLFARLEAVPTSELNPEDKRHHELLIRDFVRTGVRLDDAERTRVAEISAELDRLEKAFSRHLAADTSALAVHFDDAAALAGLPEAAVESAGWRARQDGQDGYALPLLNFTQQPQLAQLHEPASRQRIFEHSIARGCRGGEHDTRQIVSDITALRAELAQLLGFRSFAEYTIDDETADSPDAVGDLLAGVLHPARQTFEAEISAIYEQFEPEQIAPADVRYWLQRLQSERYSVDPQQVAAYFELTRVLHDGVFYAAGHLYGVEFRPACDENGEPMRAWHPDVTVYEACENDRAIGLICVDPFARAGKRGGAWMDQLVSPGRLTGELPVISMTMNITRPVAGQPCLLSMDEVRTLFHEFGHVFHGLFSDSTYPDRAGTAVPRDYVEFPSQLNEMWALHPQVLPHYARHVETGEPIPDALVARIREADDVGAGFDTIEYLAAALLDQSWHLLEAGERVDDVLTFETAVLEAAGFSPLVPPRYRTTYFSHIFASGYAAGYYAYLQAEMLAAFASEWFEEHGGLNPEAGDAFRRAVLAPGFSTDPMETFTDFFGQRPDVGPLLRRRGFAPRHDAAT